MSDKQIAYLSLAVGIASLVIGIKVAFALQGAQDNVNQIASDVKNSPLGKIGTALGFG